jgi:hypothetical protein
VVKSGDTLPVPDATGSLTPRVVEEVLGQGTDFLNDRGEALFYARFTDGTWGVFVASVPEPRSVMVAALGIAMSVMKQKSLGV